MTKISHESICSNWEKSLSAHVEFTTGLPHNSVTLKVLANSRFRALLPKTKLKDPSSRTSQGCAPRKIYHACDNSEHLRPKFFSWGANNATPDPFDKVSSGPNLPQAMRKCLHDDRWTITGRCRLVNASRAGIICQLEMMRGPEFLQRIPSKDSLLVN